MVQLFTSEIKVIEKEPCGEKLRKTKKGRLQKYAQTTQKSDKCSRSS